MPVKKIPSPVHISRILAGSAFIYSGFVKGIDPLGSAYKLADYFVAFNMDFLDPLAMPLSIALSSAEMLTGILLLGGVHMILASWAVLLFMSFFTILTFFIALNNPVADCGCFGDAVILTNWQTFWKNVVLTGFVIYIFVYRKKFGPFFSKSLYEWLIIPGFLLIILGIIFWSYLNLPVIDFRPYSIGTSIEEDMSVPPDAPADEYEITLYYEKDGEVKAFGADSIPGPDWDWVRTGSTLVSRGYEPPITNFYIESVEEGTDYTSNIIEDTGYTFILIAYDLDNSSAGNITEINRLAEWSAGRDIGFICLTASPASQINDFIERTGINCDFYHSDEITLKTIIRSNPGLLLIREGTILNKWHYRNIPHTDELKENLLSYSMEMQQKSKNNLITYGYILILLLVITVIKLILPAVNKHHQ